MMDFSKLLKIFIATIIEQFHGVSFLMWLITAACGCLIIEIIACIVRLTGKKNDKVTTVFFMLLVSYLCFVYQITFYNRVPGSRGELRLYLSNLDIRYISLKQLSYNILNVILFIPAGVIIAGILRKDKIWFELIVIILYSAIGSGIIEVAQFITKRGYFEAADMVLNVLGGFIGGVLFIVIYNLALVYKNKYL